MSVPRNPLKLLILGATGRIGRLLSPALGRAAGDTITLIQQARQPDQAGAAGWVAWDILADPDGAARLMQQTGSIDAVLCLAGVTPPHAPLDDNRRLALAALDLGRQLGAARVFLASSAAVYGPPDSALPLAETTTPQPLSAYGHAKLDMERAVARWHRARHTAQPPPPAVSCLRIGNVAGADQLLLNAAHGGPVVLDRFADGASPLRSYIGPETLARVVMSLLWTETLPAILNVAAPHPVYMDALLSARGIDWQRRPAPPDAAPVICLDTSALQAVHDFCADDTAPWDMVRQVAACNGDGA